MARPLSMKQSRSCLGLAVALAAIALSAGQVRAACPGPEGFGAWLQNFKQEAAAQGISPKIISAALDGVTYDPRVVARDRGQQVFAQSFLQFSDRMVAKYRLDHGAINLKKNAALFDRIKQEFGVPGPVIVAFWGLETDFGANVGDMPTFRSLATMAYDCRRPEKFREQLMSALRIVQRGDLTPKQMIGPWAGELGHTQFLPSVYDQYAVDYDGDGRRDLLKSVPDAMASTANYLRGIGWRAGEPWLEEVKVPGQLPWDQADISIKHPRSFWANQGVTYANGKSLPADALPASLLLPMGRNGPAFLAYPNFDIYLEWNRSLVYSTTAGYFATGLAGAPPLSRGRAPVEPFGLAETKELQHLLTKRGLDVGKIDGIIGEQTRAAVRTVQAQYGLPADSYPTMELLQALRSGR
jgi:lytic murein transglycosylase